MFQDQVPAVASANLFLLFARLDMGKQRPAPLPCRRSPAVQGLRQG